MSDTKTFTVSGTDTEINDIVSKGANPLDNTIVNEETKEEEEDDNVYEETIETDNNRLDVLLSKKPEDLDTDDVKNLKLYEIQGNEKAGEKLNDLKKEPDEKKETKKGGEKIFFIFFLVFIKSAFDFWRQKR